MLTTIAYYDSHAARYVDDTLGVDMTPLYERFLAHVPKGGLILDAGCGSGRDSKAFLANGYRVHAFDASHELAQRATAILGQSVAVRQFADFSDVGCYDGIWACASLLHVRETELAAIFRRLWTGLKPGGALYVSFKQGDGERTDGERHFTDASEARLKCWLAGLDDIHVIDCWITQDQRPQRDESWLNAIILRNSPPKDPPDHRRYRAPIFATAL